MIKFRIFNLTVLLILLSLNLFAQQAVYQISEKVIARDGNAASGISITLKGGGQATMTAENRTGCGTKNPRKLRSFAGSIAYKF